MQNYAALWHLRQMLKTAFCSKPLDRVRQRHLRHCHSYLAFVSNKNASLLSIWKLLHDQMFSSSQQTYCFGRWELAALKVSFGNCSTQQLCLDCSSGYALKTTLTHNLTYFFILRWIRSQLVQFNINMFSAINERTEEVGDLTIYASWLHLHMQVTPVTSR